MISPESLGSQHVGLEEKADHALQFGPIPFGHRDPHEDVFLTRVAVEQGVPSRGKDGERTRLLPPAEIAQGFCQVGVEPEALFGAPIGTNGWPRSIRRQLQERRRPAQVLFPKGKVFGEIGSGNLLLLPGRIISVLDGQGRQGERFAARKRAVQRRQLPPQNALRRPVADDMVHHQKEDMLPRAHTDQCRADSRLGLEMIGTPRLVDQQTLDFRLALLGPQPAQVDLLQPQRPALVHNRHGLFVDALDRAPQHLVPRDDNVQRLFQGVDVEFSPQPYCLNLVVDRHPRIELLQEPQPLLRRS